MGELRRELARQGIDARRARRIVTELEDHLACDPAAELGSPSVIAARFADELRLDETRRAAYGGFVALAVTGIALFASTTALSAAGGWPAVGGFAELATMGSGLVLVVGGQVAFVAGVLAVWLVYWSQDRLPLVQRRLRVALGAAAIAVAGEVVQAFALRTHLPSWWFALAVSCTALSAVALAAATRAVRRAAAMTPRVMPRTAGLPVWFVLATGALVVAVMTIGTAHLERSWVEGLLRGGFEGAAFAAGFFALGRFLGLRPSVRHQTVTTVRQ